ncbi:hypothetical protein BS47DRAFT_480869 [Hydnum rufescens UP504]|uniref:TERF2-interacting telomeric protein 1 Myb domain-containing protein n=1 Tax=Hydnum rufescens UP504 TaxID=1448309 RepID=A0A9P6AHJ4_9AGAM|nr:hypothetical protein BS47DRAFT_480869 [Hydnum rufescens UP504]
MSGKQDGVAARHFTAEEDSRLMAYIAKRVPFIQAGGRSGRKIYIELTGTLVHEYPWAATHSWQAWRDHYCKQREDFDSTIERYCGCPSPTQVQL